MTTSSMRILATLFVLAVAAYFPVAAQAIYLQPDLEIVPVARLVENLEEQADDDPENTYARFNLARLHGMAYALKTDEVEAQRGDDTGVWYGYSPTTIPYENQETDDAAAQAAAEQHLELAIANYREALDIDANHVAARLGLAWCLEQAGETDEAIEQYRQTIEDAWENEEDLNSLSLSGSTLTMEAAGYLIPLLDAQDDADEIAELEERVAFHQGLPQPVTPIAVPLADNVAIEDMLNQQAAVAFDVDGSGVEAQWSWITPQAAWLVCDPAGQGEIRSGLQLFGNVTFWCFWENGYQPLAALDNNADGELTGNELACLGLWHDVNGNGVSDAGEVQTLAAYDIVALNCTSQSHDHTSVAAYAPAGIRFGDGTTRATYDVILERQTGE